MRRVLTAASATFAAAVLILGLGASALAVESVTVHIKQGSLTGHACNATEWHFIITQVSEAQAPAWINVTWEGGVSATVALTKTSKSNANYTTTANLGLRVVDATATIVGAWNGQFVLSHGPCITTAAAAAPTVAATVAPTVSGAVVAGGAATARTGAAQQTAGTAQGQGQVEVGVQPFTLADVVTLPNTSTDRGADLPTSSASRGVLASGVGGASRRLAARS